MRSAILAVTATSLLTGCVVPTGPVEVTRFNRVADGQSYGTGSYIVKLADASADASSGATETNNLSLSPYIASVQREMDRIGYVRENGDAAKYTASIRVRIDNKIVGGRSPVSVGVGGGTGSYGSGVGLGLGINLGGGEKPRQITRLSVRIHDNADNAVVWEGKAEQEAGKGTPAAQPGIAASKLAEALFAGFPGSNGETITIP